ncbi:MAG: hypothetical protein ACR2G2_12880 [Pseudonocardia sp.]
MAGQRRPYRVLFEDEQNDGTIRRGTVTAVDLEHARREAQSIACAGKRAEVHYVADDGQRVRLEEYPP